MADEEIQQLTQEEKERIIARHKELVDKFNAILPEGQKLSYDPNLEKRLNDPKEVAAYRIGVEIREKWKQQDQIMKNLESRFGRCTLDPNVFKRNFVYGLKTENTQEARDFNEKMYDLYLHDQDKLAYLRYKPILNFNPQKLYECGEDTLKLAEFYRDNQQLCEDGFVINTSLALLDLPRPLQNAMTCLKKPMENYADASSAVRVASGDEFFAFPKLTIEQGLLIQANDGTVMNDASISMERAFNDTFKDETTYESSDKFLKNFKDRGFKLEDGFFVKYKALHVDPKNKVQKEVSFDEVFVKNDPNTKIVPRTQYEIDQIQCVTKSVQAKFLDKFKDKVSELTHTEKQNLSVENVQEKMKGGFFERKFNTTSVQFEHFMRTYKEFNDPKSDGYLNYDRLINATDGYIARKAQKGVRDVATAKGTDKKRLEFVHAVKEAVQYMKDNKNVIMKDVEKSLFENTGPLRSAFLNRNDVDIHNNNEINNQPQVHQVVQDMENDNEMSIEEDDLNMSA